MITSSFSQTPMCLLPIGLEFMLIFLALQKPIVFLNNLPPRDVPSFTKAIENNIIKRIKSLEELEAEIINEIYSTNINDLKDFVFGKQNYDNVLEEIVNKVKEVIAK